MHTVNSGSEMVEAKHVSGKNIFWSTLTAKSRRGKFFEFLHCPFECRANMHHKIQPNWLTVRYCLAGGSKGQWRKSNFFLSLLLPVKVDQYIYFQRHVLPLPFLSLNSQRAMEVSKIEYRVQCTLYRGHRYYLDTLLVWKISKRHFLKDIENSFQEVTQIGPEPYTSWNFQHLFRIFNIF